MKKIVSNLSVVIFVIGCAIIAYITAEKNKRVFL